MKKTKLKQRVEMLTECIKSLEKMKSTNESVIVITDSFICTSMVDEEGKTDNENIQDHIAKTFVLIISYLTHMAKRTDLNLTMLLLPILIEVAKKEGIEVKEFPKEVLEVLEVLKESEERKQIFKLR